MKVMPIVKHCCVEVVKAAPKFGPLDLAQTTIREAQIQQGNVRGQCEVDTALNVVTGGEDVCRLGESNFRLKHFWSGVEGFVF